MPDLVVDTVALHGAAKALATVSAIAEALAGDQGRSAALVPAIGFVHPTNAADSFISEWAYGVGWIATQATQAGANLTTTAATFEAIEALLSAAVGGSGAAPPAVPPQPTLVEPLPRVPPLRRGLNLVPIQLATARDVRDLIPGQPELVSELGRRLLSFADQLADARIALARISLGTWVGASARAAAADLEELAARLRAAEMAFAAASDAVLSYAVVHADAQAQAARALAMWQSAEPAAKVLRGVVAGPVPLGAPPDPEGVLVRAGAMARDAQEAMSIAGRKLADTLEDAVHGAPDDPGFFSRLRRAVTSFVIGTTEGAWGMAEGLLTLAALAVRTNPARIVYDPQGYQASSEALWSALEHGVTHPGEVGAALIDLETWKDDPFRAAGKLVPDLVAIIGTAGAVGAARGAAATNQVTRASYLVETANLRGGAFELGPGIASARVAELGFDPTSAVGRAAVTQVKAPWLTVDHWTSTAFEPGHRFAIADANDIAVTVGDRLSFDARDFYEGQQLPPFRSSVADGSVSAPRYFGTVDIYEVRTPVDGASASAYSNAQFGEGGASLTYIPDLDRAIARGEVVWVREHRFAPSTLDSRIEDPRFRMADPELPPRALDPAEERWRGQVHGAAEETAVSARQTALMTGAAAAAESSNEGAR